MKRYFVIGVLALAVTTGVACGEPAAAPTPTPTLELAVALTATPTPTPTPTQTPTPPSTPTPTQTPRPPSTPTPTQTPTLTPAPTSTPLPTQTPTALPIERSISISSVTRDHLPGMVLDQTDIEAEFSGLPLDVEDSGYVDNEAAAEDSIDPDDTASDMAAQGRLDGYEHGFFDPGALSGGSSPTERPFVAQAGVDLFDSHGSAQAFLKRMVEDFRRLQGIAIGGTTLENFQELVPPVVGTDAVAFRFGSSAIGFEITLYPTFVGWVRGPLVAFVGVAAVADIDLSEQVNRLVTRMDQRIDGVLAGEISGTPIVLAPTATPVSGGGEEVAISEGFDLPAMLITLADLTQDALIASEGFVERSDAISEYKREFEAKGLVIQIGQSQIMNLATTVKLHATVLDAIGPVIVLNALDPEVFGEVIGTSFAEAAGFIPENLRFEAVDLPEIGDAIAGMSMKMETVIGDFDAYFMFLAQGRIATELLVVGPAGQVVLGDILPLAVLMNERILEQSDEAATPISLLPSPTSTPPPELPVQIVEVGSNDALGSPHDVVVSGDYAYIADASNGLRVVDISDPANPQEVGFFDPTGPTLGLGVYFSDPHVYLADGLGLLILDVSDPTTPLETGFYNSIGFAVKVQISGGYAYVAGREGGLNIADISDPANPQHVSNFFKAGSVFVLDVDVSGSYAYVAMGGLGLRVVDVSDPANPQEVGFFDTAEVAESVRVSGSYAYLADGGDGLRIFDISDPADPQEISFYDTPGYAKDVYLSGTYAFVGDGNSSLLLVIDVSDPVNPQLAGEYETPGFVWGIYISDPYAYVANGEHGLLILRLEFQ